MADSETTPRVPPPPVVALAGWLVPGAGYWLIGERARGVVVCVTVLLTFIVGILIGGIRVIDVPGYDNSGTLRLTVVEGRRTNVAALRARPLGEVFAKPWYIGQIFTGPAALAASYASLDAAQQGVPPSTARVFDIGTLYAAVAGMLNLLVMIDAAHRAAARKADVEAPLNRTDGEAA